MGLMNCRKLKEDEKKSMRAVTTVAFDLLKTLVEIANPNPLFEIKKEFDIRLDDREFIEAFENAIMKRKFDSQESLFMEFCRPFGMEPANGDIGRMVEIWNLGLENLKLFPEVTSVLSELKKSKRLALLTNIDSFSYAAVKRKFRIHEHFDLVLPSYETGNIKPSPMAFTRVMLGLQTPPEQILMVGDSLISDITAARRLGMNAILVDRESNPCDGKERSDGEELVISSLEELIELLDNK